MAKLNFDKVVEDAVHGPKADGFVLYGKVPEYKASTELDKAELKSEKYRKASETTYNSPTNIRRVFITHSRIDIQYYVPYIIKGKPNSTNWKTKNISSLNIKEIAEASLMNEINKAGDITQQLGQNNEHILTGNGLKAIFRPWVCSNIEEIYFDYTLLATDQNKNGIDGIIGVIQKIVSGQASMEKSDLPYRIFRVIAGVTNKENLRERFPRLKTIAMISNLNSILETEHFKKLGRSTNLEEAKLTWMQDPDNMNLIKSAGGVNLYFNVTSYLNDVYTKAGKPIDKAWFNDSLDVRSGIYKFDKLILSRLKTQLSEAKEKTRVNKTNDNEVTPSSDTISSEKSEEEILLDKIYEQDGEAILTRVIRVTLIGMSMTDINNLFNSMSKEGKQKYKKLAGM